MDIKNTKKIVYRKASVAAAAAIVFLSIYIIACVISPVSWSPDSTRIALLVTPTDDNDNDIEIFGIFNYDLRSGEHFLLDVVPK
ncbi:MAG: hypothetical protein KAT56_05765, partial [Sedimentisphaerales bacterium]|nr:hypothetical protein [Sedimentisphaerales bacterium]